MPNLPWCSDVGLTCGECKHNPTQDPNHCEKAPTCPVEEPPTPPVSQCNPILQANMIAPPNADENWNVSGSQDLPQLFRDAVWTAVRGAQSACPEAWNADCLVNGEAGIDHGYLLIVDQLHKAGIKASQAQLGDRLFDHLWVYVDGRRWNATKLFNYGSGCLITGNGAFSAHGTYDFVGSTPPTPPPSTTTCPFAPCPDEVWTQETLPEGWSQDEVGNPRWHINSSEYVGRYLDNTIVVTRNEPYCAATGQSPMANGVLRASCPMRLPGSGKDDEQVALERWLSGGWRLDGVGCVAHPTNPAMFELGHDCRLCSVKTYKGNPVCSERR